MSMATALGLPELPTDLWLSIQMYAPTAASFQHLRCASKELSALATRLVEEVFFAPTAICGEAMDALQKVARPFLTRLRAAGIIHTADLPQLSSFLLFNAQGHQGHYDDKTVAHKLVMAAEALKTYGPGGALARLNKLRAAADVTRSRVDAGDASVAGGDRVLMQFAERPDVSALVARLEGNGEHPKTTKLREILVDHFARAAEAGRDSRAMVFTGTRASVAEIGEALGAAKTLRVQRFVGQGGETGMKQDAQRRAVTEFLKNDTNVLVAWGIDQKGLDIGSVDLCVFYDHVGGIGSPMRLVQRMGRTGRRSAGRVVILFSSPTPRRGEEVRVPSSLARRPLPLLPPGALPHLLG